MNDLVENCKIDGKVLLDGTDIYKDMDVNLLCVTVSEWYFRSQILFRMSIYDNMAYGPRIARNQAKNRSWMRLWSEILRQAAIWDELKDQSE